MLVVYTTSTFPATGSACQIDFSNPVGGTFISPPPDMFLVQSPPALQYGDAVCSVTTCAFPGLNLADSGSFVVRDMVFDGTASQNKFYFNYGSITGAPSGTVFITVIPDAA